MNNDLEIYAIQYYPEDLINALNKINKGINIIYSNVKSNLNIGKIEVTSRQFDTLLYNEESKILIMLMKDGLLSNIDLIDYLEKNNKRYVEVNFNYEKLDYKERYNVPELYFSNGELSLKKGLIDSVNKGYSNCKFYPLINSRIKFGFLSKYFEYIKIDSMYFNGLIQLEDKIILIKVNNKKIKDIDILKIIDSFNIKCDIIYDKYPKIFVNDKSKNLNLRKKEL